MFFLTAFLFAFSTPEFTPTDPEPPNPELYEAGDFVLEVGETVYDVPTQFHSLLETCWSGAANTQDVLDCADDNTSFYNWLVSVGVGPSQQSSHLWMLCITYNDYTGEWQRYWIHPPQVCPDSVGRE